MAICCLLLKAFAHFHPLKPATVTDVSLLLDSHHALQLILKKDDSRNMQLLHKRLTYVWNIYAFLKTRSTSSELNMTYFQGFKVKMDLTTGFAMFFNGETVKIPEPKKKRKKRCMPSLHITHVFCKQPREPKQRERGVGKRQIDR